MACRTGAKTAVDRRAAALLLLLTAPMVCAASVAFRTMRDEGDPDPTHRLTPVGRWLRTYSIDHLLMLFTVLRGDLSLVGPRPPEPDRVDLTDRDGSSCCACGRD